MFFSRKVYIVFIFIWIGICWVFLYSKKESNTLHESALVNIPKNIEAHDYWGGLSDQIIYERSLSKKNLQDCTGIKDYRLQEECQLKIATYNAMKEEKWEICWNLRSESTRSTCIWDVAKKLAKKNNQPDICKSITDISEQFECIADVRSNEREDQMVEENGLSRMNYKNQAIQQSASSLDESISHQQACNIPGIVVIPAGSTQVTIPVETLADNVLYNDELLTVKAENPKLQPVTNKLS